MGTWEHGNMGTWEHGNMAIRMENGAAKGPGEGGDGAGMVRGWGGNGAQI